MCAPDATGPDSSWRSGNVQRPNDRLASARLIARNRHAARAAKDHDWLAHGRWGMWNRMSPPPRERDAMRKTALSIAAAALMLSSGAFAQVYIGAGFGSATVDVDCAGTTTCDTSSTGWKAFGGYKFGPNWGAEVNYFDFGKAKATLDTGEGILSGEVKATGVGVGVAMFGQFSPSWSGVARVGIASTEAKVSGSVGGFSASDSETSTNAYFGLGLGYLISKNLSIDGAMDFSRVKYSGESANVRLLSIGLTLSF
jgi:OmpA-OmpF porin, OOP family